MFHARCKQEESVKLKAFRHCVFGRYSIAVPSLIWTPHKDYPLPSSTAHYEGPELNGIPSESKNLPTSIGQTLFGSMIPRPHRAMKQNEKFSTQQKEAIERRAGGNESELDNPSSAPSPSNQSLQRALSVDLDAGFEVTDLFDEEAQYVKDVLKPPPPTHEDSIRELGVEVFDNETRQSRRFLTAWKSVHEFPSIDDDDHSSTSSSSDEDGDNASLRERPPIIQQEHLSQLGRERTKQLVLHQSTMELGVEVAEEFEEEASFARQSWRGTSSSSLIPQREGARRMSRSSIRSSMGLEITEEFENEATFARQSFRMPNTDLSPEAESSTTPRHMSRTEAAIRKEDDRAKTMPSAVETEDSTSDLAGVDDGTFVLVSTQDSDTTQNLRQHKVEELKLDEAAPSEHEEVSFCDTRSVSSRKSVRFATNDGVAPEPLESPALSINRTFSIQEGESNVSDDENGDDVGFEVVPDFGY